MGGFTAIRLKDISQENIDAQNQKLKEYGVNKRYRFYSERDIQEEYQYYLKGDGVYREDLFPKDKINSYEDFKKYWNPKAVGEIFIPYVGSLNFDCYFGRTSKRALRNIGRFTAENHREIKEIYGTSLTFMERGMTKIERQIIEESAVHVN